MPVWTRSEVLPVRFLVACENGPGAASAKPEAEDGGQEGGAPDQVDGGRQVVEDEAEDGGPVLVRGAEIAVGEPQQVVAELHDERLVEAEGVAECGKLRCAHRPPAGDGADGIPGKDAEDEETGEGHGEEAGEGALHLRPGVAGKPRGAARRRPLVVCLRTRHGPPQGPG